ncbi:regulator of G protein signaling domain-containing protein [Flammula alnicola]|nr:regulator of G protein signaling domain-containing protein [Flammula alnicola]
MATDPRDPEVPTMNGLKITRFGRPFQQDTWDLFSSLMLSLHLGSHRQFPFKTFPESFLGNEAVHNLASLKFIRSPDARNLSRIITTSTSELSLTEDSASGLMQHFIEGSLIKDATQDNSPFFKKKGIYQLTAKGLRVLEGFVEDNGIESDADHLVSVLSTQPLPRPRLWRLDRRPSDDELIINKSIIMNLFRHFVGRSPNYGLPGKDRAGVRLVEVARRTKLLDGLFLEGARPLDGKISAVQTTHCFEVPRMIKWLCDCTVIHSPVEAAEIAAHFVRFGLIALLSDKAKKNDFVQIFTISGSTPRGNSLVTSEAQFRYTQTAIYVITDEGNRLAVWDGGKPFGVQLSSSLSNTVNADVLVNAPSRASGSGPQSSRDEPVDPVNIARLNRFIADPTMRFLFREFLSEDSCEYYLSFWIDVEDLKTEFIKASHAIPDVPAPPVASSSKTPIEALATERHHESLNNIPFMIYNTYLAPSSKCELTFNMDDDLRNELQKCLEDTLEYLTNKALIADVEPAEEPTLSATQLETLIKLYERIQTMAFGVMATVFVPRFIKSSKFLANRLNPGAEDSNNINNYR